MVDNLVATGNPSREEINDMLSMVRGHLNKTKDPAKVAALHRVVCRLRDL